MLEPSNRVVMVSGASRGIGRAVVERLLASGFQVSAGVRDPRGLAPSERLMVHRYDASDRDSSGAWISATLARFGALHGLVASAGINDRFALMDEDETALDALWEINVKGPLRLIRNALPQLRRCGNGRVVMLASLSGKRIANDNAGYAITKAAAIALTHAVRRESWADGVRATALCPGLVDTDMTERYRSNFPADEMTNPRDLAALIETLLLLPNTAAVAELLVNCRLESTL